MQRYTGGREDIVTLGARLRSYLAAEGITHRQLAEMVGISDETVHRWLNGGMTFEGYFRTCASLGIPKGMLMDF